MQSPAHAVMNAYRRLSTAHLLQGTKACCIFNDGVGCMHTGACNAHLVLSPSAIPSCNKIKQTRSKNKQTYR